ncbi:hypothetical protein Pint_35443 [Pistacia integerrima]|uniref:Uncharacterized protein n=2 Tax=Pistacia TaxID=55512 RepID=A0ACC1AP06_9ROSI|nr:hypothetical protein Pint_35443 [Pistacia integerrima]KAJ0088417.1 hypothetical protein Patl1_31891 [Pistacia atlantica]
MPSELTETNKLPLVPTLSRFNSGLCSHRLKHLEKSDRRGNLS